mgnify:CR=1 FL=1
MGCAFRDQFRHQPPRRARIGGGASAHDRRAEQRRFFGKAGEDAKFPIFGVKESVRHNAAAIRAAPPIICRLFSIVRHLFSHTMNDFGLIASL